MSRKRLNFIVDTAALALLALLTSIGFLLRWTLPPGSGGRDGGSYRALWGLSRHDWGAVHFWLSVAVLLVLLLHVLLHWGWLLAMLKGRGTSPTGRRLRLAGAALFLLLLAAVVVAPLLAPTTEVARSDRALGPDHPAERAIAARTIRGSMSLRELAEHAGRSLPQVRHELGLPPDVPASARLGRLQRAGHLKLAAVRARYADPAAHADHAE